MSMLAVAALALSLFGHGQIATRSVKVGQWTTQISTDRFTHAVSCSLAGRRISLRRDTLVFHLGQDIDTTGAVFRIDDGSARSIREARLTNEDHGFFLDHGPIGNPSDGEVALPVSLAQGAKSVTIRASTRYTPRTFNLSQFPDALAAAKAAGCPEGAF